MDCRFASPHDGHSTPRDRYFLHFFSIATQIKQLFWRRKKYISYSTLKEFINKSLPAKKKTISNWWSRARYFYKQIKKNIYIFCSSFISLKNQEFFWLFFAAFFYFRYWFSSWFVFKSKISFLRQNFFQLRGLHVLLSSLIFLVPLRLFQDFIAS
jgi:hypothetical protein